MIASDSDSRGLSVDVVIPTFRRPEKLERCLDAIKCQTIAPSSIIVIDDSEKDLGPAISRNLGWKKGSSDVVAFTDDDCVPAKDWIENIIDEFLHNDVDFIEGKVTTVMGDSSISMDPHPKDRWNRFKTANMAYRRKVLEKTGGFDERYYIHREDTDLAWRAINSGHKFKWAEGCVVHHPDRGGVQRLQVKSELLLYHCDPMKYREVASSFFSFQNIRSGELRNRWVAMRGYRHDSVLPLNRRMSLSLWGWAFVLAILRKMRLR